MGLTEVTRREWKDEDARRGWGKRRIEKGMAEGNGEKVSGRGQEETGRMGRQNGPVIKGKRREGQKGDGETGKEAGYKRRVEKGDGENLIDKRLGRERTERRGWEGKKRVERKGRGKG